MSYLRFFFSISAALLLVACKSSERVVHTYPDAMPASEPSVAKAEAPAETYRVVTDLVKVWPAQPVPVKAPVTIASRLDSLFADSLLRYAQVALYVYDLTADSSLYERGIQQRMRPASTQKLLTSITALGLLGADYQYRTSLYLAGERKGQTWQGPVSVKGGLDPAFTRGNLQKFVSAIKSRNIRVINGPLLLDVSFKDTLEAGAGWCWDDDNPSLSPLLVNGKNEFATLFREELQRQGIRIAGPDSVAVVPPKAVRIAGCQHGIATVLRPMMKESDNLMAESMFYQLAARKGKPWATAEDAAKTVKAYIARHVTADASLCRVADGSGLSPYNFVTPEVLVGLLRHADAQAHIREALLPSLPIAGVDGTLKRRMTNTTAQGNVRAKTGSLTGVSSLAGYATAANGHRLCFAIIVQGQRRGAEARSFQDKVCCILTEQPM